MYIEGSLILYIIDQAIRFQAERQLQNINAKYIWDILYICWINIYLEFPNLITTNASKNFVSKEFKQYIDIMGIKVKIVLVEAHNSIGIVE